MGAPPDSEPVPVAGFHLVHRVAQSYLGSLWVALDQRQGEPGKPVLLRCLQLPTPTPIEALQRAACAGRDAMALSHENVLSVLSVIQQEDSLGLAYGYVEAESLRSLQSWAALRGLSFPVGVTLRIVIDLLRGVKALHGALVGWPSAPPFGGVSPDSVLIARDGRTRLCDPLISSCAALLEGVGQNTAKLAYAAPEQVHATAPLAPASDVFTCGVMLWELLAGRRLLSGTRASIERKLLEHDLPKLRDSARVEISDELVELVERCLSSDAGKRPAHPAAFAAELEQCGHEVASVAEVAQFMTELAGPYFERRSASIRARLPAALHALLQAPADAPPATHGRKHARSGPEPSSPSITAPLSSAAPAPGLKAPPATAMTNATSRGAASRGLTRPKLGVAVPRAGSGRRLVPLPARASSSSARTLIGVAPMGVRADAPAVAPPRVPSPPASAAAPKPSTPEEAESEGWPDPLDVEENTQVSALPASEPPKPPEPGVMATVPGPSAPPTVVDPPEAQGERDLDTLLSPGSALEPASPESPTLIDPPDAMARLSVPDELAIELEPLSDSAEAPAPDASEARAEDAGASSPPLAERTRKSRVDAFATGSASALNPAVAEPLAPPVSSSPHVRAQIGKRTISGVGSPLQPPIAGTLPLGFMPPRREDAASSSAAFPAAPPSGVEPVPAPAEPFAKAISWPPAGTSLPPPSSDTARSAQPPWPPHAPGAGAASELRRSEAPSSGAPRASGWSHAPELRRSRSRTVLAGIAAALVVGISVGVALFFRAPREEAPSAAAALAVHEERTSPEPPPVPAPEAPEAPDPPAESAGAEAAPAPEPESAPSEPDTPPSEPEFATPELNDEQLARLFALERRKELPSCAARLGASAPRHNGKDARKSQAQLKAARRELVRGDNDKAHTLLCSATAHFAGNTEAWQALAELALHLGDPSAAKSAVEKALKRKPRDATLLGIQGDAHALAGDLKRSRELWARSAKVTGSGAERTRRLVALFGAIGDRKLRSYSYGSALAYYRRAVVLGAGSHGPSAGMGEVLRRMDQPVAAAAWNERVARVFPKDPRAQVAGAR